MSEDSTPTASHAPPPARDPYGDLGSSSEKLSAMAGEADVLVIRQGLLAMTGEALDAALNNRREYVKDGELKSYADPDFNAVARFLDLAFRYLVGPRVEPEELVETSENIKRLLRKAEKKEKPRDGR